MIRVRVPATTANVGPAFDCMGIALNRYTSIQFDVLPSDAPSTLVITGCPSEFANRDNLVYQSFVYTLHAIGQPVPSIAIDIDSDIPVSRGLGSSAACIVAGVLAANALHHYPLNKHELLEIATKLEGHPDNVAPAIYGGLCVSAMDTQTTEIHIVNCVVHSNIEFCALIPNHSLSTAKARGVLPETIPFTSAVHNIGRSLLVLKALEQGNLVLLVGVLSDKLHEPYRQSLIPDYDVIKMHAKDQGDGTIFLSGAGPTLMYVGQQLPAFLATLHSKKNIFTWQWDACSLEVDKVGATVERSDING